MDNFLYAENAKKAKRIIIKIGSAILTHPTGKINIKRIENLTKAAADLSNSGREIILVTSGAVSVGAAKLGMRLPLEKIEDKKAAAAVGQAELMSIYDRFFMSFGIKIAQILLTRDIIENSERRSQAEETLKALLDMSCVPIVNENDTVSSDEIKFSGNDILSAYVAKLCEAELLINLSDVDGLYNKNPAEHSDAELVREVREVTPEILAFAGGAGSSRGTGGMITKLKAALLVREQGIPMIIANGADPDILYDILDGRIFGTYIKNN
ncbi:MAG: glutamate 5-kinase [Oscillospiraceae bacterium]|nr:glutamate 5-kinase [Oscillospiraceae bacterium]